MVLGGFMHFSWPELRVFHGMDPMKKPWKSHENPLKLNESWKLQTLIKVIKRHENLIKFNGIFMASKQKPWKLPLDFHSVEIHGVLMVCRNHSPWKKPSERWILIDHENFHTVFIAFSWHFHIPWNLISWEMKMSRWLWYTMKMPQITS